MRIVTLLRTELAAQTAMCWASAAQTAFYLLGKAELEAALQRHGYKCSVASFRRTLRNYGFVTCRETAAVEHEHFNGSDGLEQLARMIKRKPKQDTSAKVAAPAKRKLVPDAVSPHSPPSPHVAPLAPADALLPLAEADGKRARLADAAPTPDVAALLGRMRELERVLAATQATVRSDAEEIRALREENALLRAAAASPVSAPSPEALSPASLWSHSSSPAIDFSLDAPVDDAADLSPAADPFGFVWDAPL